MKSRNSLFLILPALLFGVDPAPVGNFAVPVVTQIAPLVSFGQLLIGEKALLPQISGFYAHAHKEYTDVIAPNVIYGISDDFALFFYAPFTPKSRSGSSHSSGMGDCALQFEYGFYGKKQPTYTLQSSLVWNVQFPTGSKSKNPPTGTGSFAFFLGTTFAYLSTDWYAFVSPGANFTTKRHDTKSGNSYLYQCGIARYIKQLSPPGWVFDLMLEFDGTYSVKNKIRGTINPDSGGNIIMLTPSIWLSSKQLIIQWGIGFPIVQQLNGNQDKLDYSIGYTLGIAIQL